MTFSEEIHLFSLLTSWDWSVFLGTVFLTLLSALYGWGRKRKKQPPSPPSSPDSWKEHILMGRQLTLPLFVSTLVATWYGDILGVTQISFRYGIYNFLTQGIFWYISYIIFALWLVKSIRRLEALTFPDLLEKWIGRRPAQISAGLIFLKTLPITQAISVGILLKVLFNLSFPWAVFIGLLFVFLYTLVGGFRSVVYSDFIQFILMYVGIGCVVLFSLTHFGGISYLTTHCPPAHFSFLSRFSFLDTFVWFFIGISTTFLNPTFYQRCLSAKSDRVAIRGIFISILFWCGFDVCTTLIGLYAKATLPHADPLNASLTYCLHVLPSGFKGLFLGAVLATILSTLDSFLFVSSTVLSYDLKVIRFKSPFLSHAVSTLITAACTFGLALLYEGDFEKTWRTLKGIFGACIFCPVLLCFWRPQWVSSRSFMLSALMVSIGMTLWNTFKPYPLDAFYVGNFISLMTLLLFRYGKNQALFQKKSYSLDPVLKAFKLPNKEAKK